MKTNSKKDRQPVSVSFKIVKIVVAVIFAIHVISLLFPVIWGIVVSITPGEFVLINGLVELPNTFRFENYLDAFTSIESSGSDFFGMFLNSIWWAVGGAALGVIVSAITAYAVARYKFFGGKVIYWVAVISMMIPVMSNLTALFKLADALNILDSPLMLITQMGGMGFNFLVLYSFFKGISGEYAEAAFIDGAGHFRVFIEIYAPLAVSSMIALAMTTFIALWGDAQFPLMFIESYPTLSSGLYNYRTEQVRSNEQMPILYASLLISTIPVIVLFMAFRDKFMDMQISGGIKG